METGFGYDMDFLAKKPNVLRQADPKTEAQEDSTLKPPTVTEIRQPSRRSILTVSNGQSSRNPSQRQIANRLRAEKNSAEELRKLKQDYERMGEEQRYKHFKPFKLLDPSLNPTKTQQPPPIKSTTNTPTEASSPPQIVLLPPQHRDFFDPPKQPLRDIFKAHLENNQTSIRLYNEYCRQKTQELKGSLDLKLEGLKSTLEKTQQLQRSREDGSASHADFHKKLFEQNCGKLEHENMVKQFQLKLKKELEEGGAHYKKIKELALRRQETSRSRASSHTRKAVFARQQRQQPTAANSSRATVARLRSNHESEDQLVSR